MVRVAPRLVVAVLLRAAAARRGIAAPAVGAVVTRGVTITQALEQAAAAAAAADRMGVTKVLAAAGLACTARVLMVLPVLTPQVAQQAAAADLPVRVVETLLAVTQVSAEPMAAAAAAQEMKQVKVLTVKVVLFVLFGVKVDIFQSLT